MRCPTSALMFYMASITMDSADNEIGIVELQTYEC